MRQTSSPLLFRSRRLLAAAVSLGAALSISLGSGPPAPRVSFSEDRQGVVSLEIEMPPVRWTRVGGGWLPSMEGFGRLAESGSPDVPARRERIAVEPGGGLRLLDVEVEWAEGTIPGDLLPYPAHQAAAEGLRLERGAVRGRWPERPVEIVTRDGALRSLQFVAVELRPLQLDLDAGRFRVATRLVLTAERSAGTQPAAGGGASRAVRNEALAIHGADSVGRIRLGGGDVSALGGGGGGQTDGPSSFPAFQLGVQQGGLHRISYAWAQANAPDLLTFLTGNDPRQLRLTVLGVEVPILVEGEADGVFDSAAVNPPDGDALVFYGQPLAGADPFGDDEWQDGDFSDENIYRLDVAPAPARIAAAAGTRSPVSGYAVPATFRETVRHEEDVKFQGFVPAPGDDHWFVDPFVVSPVCIDTSVETCDVTVSSTFCSSCNGPTEVCCADQVDQAVDTPGHAGGSIDLRVAMMGIRGTTFHRSELLVDGAPVDLADWDGFARFVQGVDQGPITFTPGPPLGSTTTVTLRAPLGRTDGGGGDVTRDWLAYDWIEIDYDRSFAAVGSALEFSAPDANREVQVAGFGAAPEIWEISDETTSAAGTEVALPRRVQGVSLVGNEARFEVDANGAGVDPRRFVAATGAGYQAPSVVREDLPPSAFDPAFGSIDTLKSGALAADWVVIGPAAVLDLSTSSSLDVLRGHRVTQGLTTLVVDVQDVFDEFTEGISDPQAIKDFIRYTLQNWATPPRFFVLVGDGTWDHKNNYGNPTSRQFVPTYMFDLPDNSQFGYHPSDTWMVAVIGSDDLPDAAIGRIPAHSLAEAEEVFRKIHAYETGPKPASWSGRTLLVAEHDLDVGNEFFRAQDDVFDTWFSSGPQAATKIYEQDPLAVGCNVAADNQNASIDSNVNAGAAVLTFAGHGGFKNWGKSCSFFTTDNPGPDDLDDINLNTPLPFTVQANCITGNFAATTSPASSSDTQYSFVEDWLLTERKGVVGGLAPSHLSFTFEIDAIFDVFFRQVLGPRKERLVAEIDAALRAEFDSLNNAVGVRSFILQGDPALTLAVPAPPAPEILSIAPAGSGELSLSWTSVGGASSYRVYRALNPSGPYSLAGSTAATTFLDSGLTNCQEHYYYVVSVDADDFESRWSNFNEDCGGAAVDCRSGTPDNPTPPAAPALLSVTDTQNGGELDVTWDASSPEPDLLRYRVSWGTSSGVYTGSKLVPVGFGSTRLTQLSNNMEYFVAVQAENCSQSSLVGNELSAVPHLVRGINPPRSIQDLMVFNEPDLGDGIPDNRLSWSVPTDTVWGVATVVQSIEVHGSSAGPAFPVDGGTLLASLGPSATEWFHEDQAAPAAPDWYYVVVAVDASGRRSAAGAELPAAIDDLILQKLAGGSQIGLSWSPVDASASDGPSNPSVRLTVSAYNVYGRASLLSRVDTGPANELQAGITGTSVTLPMPAGDPGDIFTYQVLAEDSHGSESVW